MSRDQKLYTCDILKSPARQLVLLLSQSWDMGQQDLKEMEAIS